MSALSYPSEHDEMQARAWGASPRGAPMPSGPRLPSSLMELIPPELRGRLPSPEMVGNLVLGSLPGSGDYMAARDAIGSTGAGLSALGQGDYMRAGARGIDALTAALGVLPMVPYAAGMFAGRGAKTADVVKLGMAEKMAAAGASPEDIWRSTGWFQGADGKWRFEIDDSVAQLDFPAVAKLASHGDSRTNMLIPHPEMQRAYDRMNRGYHVEREASGIGSFDIDRATIGIGPQFLGYDEVTKRTRVQPQALRSVLLHEMQHATQELENFGRGGAPLATAGGKDEYRRLAGEVEARAVQERMDLTPQQRASRAPWLDYDVPIDQQIVRGIEP